jgi:hypothetical protein
MSHKQSPFGFACIIPFSFFAASPRVTLHPTHPLRQQFHPRNIGSALKPSLYHRITFTSLARHSFAMIHAPSGGIHISTAHARYSFPDITPNIPLSVTTPARVEVTLLFPLVSIYIPLISIQLSAS